MKRLLIIFVIILIYFLTSSQKTSELVRVTRVIDGDTIEITGGIRVRYIGIDAPEIAHENTKAECYGQEAMEANQALLQGQSIRLEKDVSDTDDYGRQLRYVYVGDELINTRLVESGFARAWPVPPNTTHQNLLYEAQQKAKISGVGLWSVCTK